MYADCPNGQGFACSIEIAEVAARCYAEVGAVVGIIDCITQILGAGHDCIGCICWVIESIFGDQSFC